MSSSTHLLEVTLSFDRLVDSVHPAGPRRVVLGNAKMRSLEPFEWSYFPFCKPRLRFRLAFCAACGVAGVPGGRGLSEFAAAVG